MKLVTYRYLGQTRLGALMDDFIVDLNRAHREVTAPGSDPARSRRADVEVPAEMLPFLQAGPGAMQLARHALEAIQQEAAGPESRKDLAHEGILAPLDAAKLLPPVPRPPKIVAAWVNYGEHGKEAAIEAPDRAPLFFSIFPTAVIGPTEPIVLPRISKKVDYEAELALVIGLRGKDIPAEKAYEHVAGYTILNDVSARDFSLKAMIGVVGPSLIQKTFDTFAPMGPVLVTADEIPDPHTLGIRLDIDGEVLQDSNTGEMNHKIPRIIEYLSQVATLEPGDVITTGTPPGVGFARTPPRWLKPGETVRIEIENIGVLENPVVAAE